MCYKGDVMGNRFFEDLIECANYYLENECIVRNGIVVDVRSHYYDFYVETAESDYKALDQVLYSFNRLKKSVQNIKMRQIQTIDKKYVVSGLWDGISIVMLPKELGVFIYNLETKTMTIPCIVTQDALRFTRKNPNRDITINEYKQYLKQVLVKFFDSNRNGIIHELTHRYDKMKDVKRIPDEKASYGTPEYYNSAHEFNAYFNEMISAIRELLEKSDDVATTFLSMFSVEDGELVADYNSVFEYLLTFVDVIYANVMTKLNDKFRRHMISRLYKLVYYDVVDSGSADSLIQIAARNFDKM